MEQLSDIDIRDGDSLAVLAEAQTILKTVELVIDPESAKVSLRTYLYNIEKNIQRTIAQIETNMAGIDAIFETFGETVTDADREKFTALTQAFQLETMTLTEKITSLRERIDRENDPKKIMGLERVIVGSDTQLTEAFTVSVDALQQYMAELSRRALKKNESVVTEIRTETSRQIESEQSNETLVFRTVYDPEARKLSHPDEIQLPDMDGKLEKREITIDLVEAYERSMKLYEQHLPAFAEALRRELPNGIEALTDAQRRELQEYAERGFDLPMIMPSLAALEAMQEPGEDLTRTQERVVHAMSLDGDMQPKKAWIAGEQGFDSNPPLSEAARTLRERPYIRLFHRGAVPPETKNLKPQPALAVSDKHGWTAFGYDEFAIAERMTAEQRENHDFGVYSSNSTSSNWTWALANRTMDRVTVSRAGAVDWNPTHGGLSASWSGARYRSAALGVRPSVALKI
jgi:hypothetical protein